VQTPDNYVLEAGELKTMTRRAPTAQELADLLFAWKVCKHVKSNAIVFAREGRTLGIGAGQMSRVDSVKIAVMKAQSPLEGTAVASDAFFPFPDGVEEAAKAGAKAVIQPGGSMRDAEVIAAADRLGWLWCLQASATSGISHVEVELSGPESLATTPDRSQRTDLNSLPNCRRPASQQDASN